MIERMTPSDAAAVSRFLSEKALSEPSGKPAELLHRVIAHLNGYIKSETAGIINDGGPAFPVADPFLVHSPGNVVAARRLAGGMSLRDYFAAKAMQGFCANQCCQPTNQEHFDNLAEDAYRTADAMLKARSEGGAA